MSKLINTTEEAVIKAAKECPQAEQVLKTLFPEVFEGNEIFCTTADIFILKNKYDSIYIFYIDIYNNTINIRNIRTQRDWSTKTKISELSCANETSSIRSLTVNDLRKIIGKAYINIFDIEIITIKGLIPYLQRS